VDIPGQIAARFDVMPSVERPRRVPSAAADRDAHAVRQRVGGVEDEGLSG
jgi:hypothetical protein